MRMTVFFPKNEDIEVPQSNPKIQESEILVEDRFPLSPNEQDVSNDIEENTNNQNSIPFEISQ